MACVDHGIARVTEIHINLTLHMIVSMKDVTSEESLAIVDIRFRNDRMEVVVGKPKEVKPHLRIQIIISITKGYHNQL